MQLWIAIGVLGVAIAPLCVWLWRERSALAALGFLAVSVSGTIALAALLRPAHVPEAQVTNRPIQVPEQGDVGSTACRACHPDQYASWDRSYHSSMTQLPSDETVAAPWDLELSELYRHPDGSEQRLTYTLARRGEEFWVHSPDDPAFSSGPLPPGLRQIVMVTGSHHQQFYWYSIGEGRHVAQLPLAYSIRDSRWLPITSLFMTPPSRPEPQTGAWNLVCIRCHSTHGRPGAVRAPDAPQGTKVTYRSFVEVETQATEFGIACESCHGGAERHAQLNRNPLRRYANHFRGQGDDSIVNPARLDSRRASDVCGSCHSNHVFGSGTSEDLAEYNRVGFRFRPGDDLADTRLVIRHSQRDDPRLAPFVAESPAFFSSRFWPDGETNSSGREYNDLLETGCFQRGELSCLSCHRLHRVQDDPRPESAWADDQLDHRKLGNGACLDCHTEYRDRVAEHSHHAEGSSGSLCYNCHMPHTAYGLRKQSRSHRVASPSVRTALETGRPDACTLCHLDRPLVETARTLEQWYGIEAPEISDPEHHFTGFGAVAALRGNAAIRTMLAWHMGWKPAIEASGGGDWMVPLLAILLEDRYASVRYAAGESLRAHAGFEDFAYDFIAPAPRLEASRRDALARWDAVSPPERRAPREPVLIGAGGVPNQARIERYQAERDDRPVNRLE